MDRGKGGGVKEPLLDVTDYRANDPECADRHALNRDRRSTDLNSGDLEPHELIARHQRGVWRYLRMLGCDEATADDLTQETFLRVLRRKNFVQHNDSATSSYLRRTAYNLLVSRHRKMGRVKTVAEPAILDEIWNRWAGKDLSGDAAVEALRLCLEKLTDRAQTALKMRFGEEASRVEIGEALGHFRSRGTKS